MGRGRKKKGNRFSNGVDFPIKKLKSAKGTDQFFKGHTRSQEILMHAILHRDKSREILGGCAVQKRVHDRFVRKIWGSTVGHGSPIHCGRGR